MSRFLYLYAGMTVVAAALARATGCPSLFRTPLEAETLWISLAIAVGLSFVVVQGGKLLERAAWYREMAVFLKRMLTSPELLGPELDAEKAFVIAVYSSVGEEAFFRGFVQPWCIASIASWFELTPDGLLATSLGVVAASLVFGLLHFPVVRELRPWTVFAVLAGLGFGALAAWSQCLLAPVLAHLLINWLNLKHLAALPVPPPHSSSAS